MSVQQQSAIILLVEDNPGHALLIEKNLRRAGLVHEVIVLDDGQKAVDYLLRQGEYASRETLTPSLVLLDLNLPVLSGDQVLKIIKSDERTRQIPVAVLTTSDSPAEIARCYELGCNLYITKPVAYDQFSEAIQRISLFLSIVKTPGRE